MRTLHLLLIAGAVSLASCKKNSEPSPLPNGANTAEKLMDETNGWKIICSLDTKLYRSDYRQMTPSFLQVANGDVYQSFDIDLDNNDLPYPVFFKTPANGKTESFTPKTSYQTSVFYLQGEPDNEYEIRTTAPDQFFLLKNGGHWDQPDIRLIDFTEYHLATTYFSPTLKYMASVNPYGTVTAYNIATRQATHYAARPFAGVNPLGNARGALIMDENYTNDHPGHHRIIHASMDFVPNENNVFQLKVADMCDSISTTVSTSDVIGAKSVTQYDTVFTINLANNPSAITYVGDCKLHSVQDADYVYILVYEYNRLMVFRYGKHTLQLEKIRELSVTDNFPGMPLPERVIKVPGKPEVILANPSYSTQSRPSLIRFHLLTGAITPMPYSLKSETYASLPYLYNNQLYMSLCRRTGDGDSMKYIINVAQLPGL